MENIKGNTYYIKAPTNVGIYVGKEKVFIIDPGSSKRVFREIREKVKGNREVVVLNTHHHSDHVYLDYIYEKELNATVYASEMEAMLIRNPELSASFLFCSSPPKIFRNRFFISKSAKAFPFPEDLEIDLVPLAGHTPGHTGFLTPDGVLFSGDIYFGRKIIDKYYYPYHFSISDVRSSLKKIYDVKFDFVVPAHGSLTSDPSQDINYMVERIDEIESLVLETLREPRSIEEICFSLIENLNLKLTGGGFYLFRSFVSAIVKDLEEELEEEGGKWKRI